jgi:hypothetical protein
MSSGTGSRFPDREGSEAATFVMAPDLLGGLWCAACPVAPDPASLYGGLRAATHPAILCGPRATSIKKSQVCLPI